MNPKRVLISHPSVAPFIQQAAMALEEANSLEAFLTSIAWHRSELSPAWHRRLHNRCVETIPKQRIRRRVFGELVRLAIGKIDTSRVLTDYFWEWSEHYFDRQVASAVTSDLDAIYSYEHVAEFTFERARHLGVRTVYDVPAPETSQIRDLMAREISSFPEMDTTWFQQTQKREPKRLLRRKREWDLADTIICASEFTKSTFATAGYDVSKVHVVPYGAPAPIAECHAASGGSSSQGKMSFIWAGTFSLRKGAHYLLDVWRQNQLGVAAHLHVFGSCDLPTTLLTPTPEGITFHGSISHADLLQHYEKADALIFPSLYDGFGMVVTEALSRGCPVITTPQVGAASFIQHEVNGLIIPAGNSQAIADIISHCVSKRDVLKSMRVPAVRSAARWQWHHYREKLRQTIGITSNESA